MLLSLAFAGQADPTKPASGYLMVHDSNIAISNGSSLKLQIIQHNIQGKSATINGHLLHIGDQYQGYTLTGISSTSVILSRADEQRILQLLDETIKNYDK
ncbi:hypothetical protein VT06_13545 [Arsukibacterium sp. MJ3]|nr:hypothetical protein VT06_13545 [Arsukibacterium sp. MJ3]